MGKVIDLFPKEKQLSPEQRAHLIQKITDISIEIALLTSEKERLESRL